MSNLSHLTLPNNTTVDIKDNTQARSDHRHYESDIVPLVHKTYASTSYYATSGSHAESTWYFMSVKPDSWYKPWRINFKIRSFCPSYTNVDSYTWATLCGRADSIIYANWNERYDVGHYYTSCCPLKQAGFNAGYGHAVGINIIWGTNYTNSAYYRTFELDYYECENCTVTILDTPVKWASWSGGNTTNYNGQGNYNAVDRGLYETGDSDSGHYYTRRVYSDIKAGSNKVFPYTIIMQNSDGRWESIVTSSSTGTKSRNTHGFRLGQMLLMYANATYNENAYIDNYNVWSFYGNLVDHRYSFNTANDSTNGLTANKPVYLVGTIGNDGLFYLDSTWWTQTLPTSNDGKLYIYLGDDYDYYRMNFDSNHPVYKYVNGAVRQVTQDALTVNGLTVQTAVPSGAKFTDTTYSAGNGLTLSGTTFNVGKRWNAVTQGQKWSRIYYAEPVNSTVGTSGFLNVTCTRGSVVVNTTFLLTSSHAGSKYANCQEISSNNYTPMRVRLVTDTNGKYYFEIYDTAQSIASGTTQTWNCCYIPLADTTLTCYTSFTDGSTIPSGYTALNDFTTTTAEEAFAIKKISRSGTTFTATRQDGSTFTFTQKDDNTTYTFANGTNGFTVTPSGGSAQTVTVTPSISNNVTGSGTSGYLAKFNGANTITNAVAFGSDTTKYLRNDGTWQVPSTRQIFFDTPAPPYALDDLWFGDGSIRYCTTARASGVYEEDDWTVSVDEAYATSLVQETVSCITGNSSEFGGRFIIELDSENNSPLAVVFACDTTITSNTKLWRFDASGFRFSSDGGQTYSPITNTNGELDASYITSGVLDASRVSIINLNTSDITTGDIYRGGTNNTLGTLVIKNQQNEVIGEINKLGVKIYGQGDANVRPYIIFNDTEFFAGYDANGNQIFKVVSNVVNMVNASVTSNLTVGNKDGYKISFVPITIKDANDVIVNDGVAIV